MFYYNVVGFINAVPKIGITNFTKSHIKEIARWYTILQLFV